MSASARQPQPIVVAHARLLATDLNLLSQKFRDLVHARYRFEVSCAGCVTGEDNDFPCPWHAA